VPDQPTSSHEDSAELLRRYRQGDQQAAEIMFTRYLHRLVALAHSRLSARLARRIDPEDIVQSAYRSFFLNARDGRYALEHSGDLWRLLVVITLNKLRQKVEYHTAAKRRFNQELSGRGGDLMLGVGVDVLQRDPSPQETLAVLEEIQQLTARLDPLQKQIVELRLQGYRIEEIADEVQRSERTVRRVMDKIKQRLEHRLHESEQPP
jgi:RNA polymerase sigma factor (sigma-70 family)